MIQQTKPGQQVDEASLQQTSAATTVANIEREAELNKKPVAKKAKVFYSVQPGSSMSMLTATGRTIIFRDGKCITKDPVEIDYLQKEVDSGNPALSTVVDEVEDAKTIEELIREAEARAVERYIAQTKGSGASGGTSDNSGGTIGSTGNMSVAAPLAPQSALDVLRARAQAAVQQAGPEVAAEQAKQQATAAGDIPPQMAATEVQLPSGETVELPQDNKPEDGAATDASTEVKKSTGVQLQKPSK